MPLFGYPALLHNSELRYLVKLLTLIANGPDTNYYLLTDDFKVSQQISDLCNKAGYPFNTATIIILGDGIL
jgi:uncharacterized protein YjbK